MTITCSFTMIMMPKSPNKNMASRATAIRTRHVRVLRASIPLKKFSKVNKIFEDRERGIVCYRDDEGELICQGYDEGPRYEDRSPETTYCESYREVEASGDCIQLTRLQIFEEDVDVYRLVRKQKK